MFRAASILTLLISLWIQSAPLSAQPAGTAALLPVSVTDEVPEMRAAVSADEIFIGETIDFQIEIRNAQNPVAPDIAPLHEQFTVQANGDQSRNQSSTFIINGRRSEQHIFSHIYLYRLTPKTAGNLTIPSLTVTVDNHVVTSNAVSLLVQDAEEQDLVQLEILADRTTVYPTQPFSVKLRAFVTPLPDSKSDPLTPLRRSPPQIQLNWVDEPDGLSTEKSSEWLQPLLSKNGTGFALNELTTRTDSIFGGSQPAVFDLHRGRETRSDREGKSKEYFAYELSRTFTPEKTGSYTFGPALVKGTFVAGTEGDEYTARKLVAIAPAVLVEVRDVPVPRPPGYTGAIGEYRIAATASPMKLRTGDPVTFTLEFIRGINSGSLERISAPDLTTISDIGEHFDIIDRSPTGRVEGGTKKFSYGLRPRRAGVSLPAIPLHAFDPDTEQFAELRTSEIALEVTTAEAVADSDLIGSVPSSISSGIRKSDQGIFQNVTDPDELYDETVSLRGWIAAVAGCWGLAGIVIAAVQIHQRSSTDSARSRKQSARKKAQHALAEVSQLFASGARGDALRKLRNTVIGLVADICNLVPEGLTSANVATLLKGASVDQRDLADVVQLLESLEAAEYGAGGEVNVEDAIERAKSLIERISRQLERSHQR